MRRGYVGVVQNRYFSVWSLAGSQAFYQQFCGFELGLRRASLSAALGLSHQLVVRGPGGSATLGLCVGQLASVPGAHPPTRGFRCGRHARVSGVGGQLGFQLWSPSPLIWVCATGLQVSAGAAYPSFAVQGLRGEGHQRPRLLGRVL